MTTRWARPRLTDVDVVSGEMLRKVELIKMLEVPFSD